VSRTVARLDGAQRPWRGETTGVTLKALIAWPDDKLTGAVAERLSQRGERWRWLVPANLGSTSVSIDAQDLYIDGEHASGVLWRARPEADFSVEFAEADRVFVDSEVRSFWLAALNLPGLATTIRPDAALFFSRSGWMLWRDALGRQGVSLSPLHYGSPQSAGAWLPYGTSRLRKPPPPAVRPQLGAAVARSMEAVEVLFARGLRCGSELLSPAAQANVERAVRVLEPGGLAFGEMLVDTSGSILAVDALPQVDDLAMIARLSSPLADLISAPADRR